MYNEQYYKLIHRRPKLKMLGVIFFFHFYANVQRSVTYGIYCYITKNLTTRKRDSRLQHKCSLIKRSLVRFAGPTRSESAPHLLVWVYRERCVHILYPFCIRTQYYQHRINSSPSAITPRHVLNSKIFAHAY